MPVFSLMLTALAALIAYASFRQLYIAIRKRGSPLHLTFSLTSLGILGSVIGNLMLVNSDTAAGVIAATRIRVIFGSLSIALFPWFVSYYTGFRPRLFLISFSSVALLFLFLRCLDPFLLTYTVILDPKMITLPWHEQIAVFNARTNWWIMVYYAIGITALVFLYVSAFRQFRRGERLRAAALSGAVTLLFATLMNDMVVILKGLQWLLLGDFGWMAMILLLEFTLTEDIIRAGEIKQSLVESERTLRISEEKYRLLAENVTDVIWTMDLDTKVTYITPSTEKLHGWKPGEWKNMRMNQFLPPDSLATTLMVMGNEMGMVARGDYDRKRVITYEIEQYRKDGSTFWTEVSARFMWDGSGKPAGIIGVTRDISERKKAEIALLLQNRVLTEINRLGMELASFPPEASMHEYLARELKQITGAAVAVVSEYDQTRKLLEVKHLELDASIPIDRGSRELIDSYLTVIPVNDDSYARMMTETLAFRDTVSELTFGTVPEEISGLIIRTFDLDRYIGISYIYDGTLYGTSVLCMKKGTPLPPEELLRPFASLAAVSLRKNRTEEKLRKSLEEKNVLIKEVHHRVKNNLQVIVSLLTLQAERITDREARAMHNESIARLHSMALIHERIYRSRDFVNIDMGPYVRELVGLLLAAYALDESAVHVAISVRDVLLDVGRAVPCALMLNELVTNALKHGIKNDPGTGQLDISFIRSGDTYRLVVADRGPCMEVDAFNAGEHKTLGLQLIKGLVKQLRGTVELTVQDGCSFTIEFPA